MRFMGSRPATAQPADPASPGLAGRIAYPVIHSSSFTTDATCAGTRAHYSSGLMYQSGQGGLPSREELRGALARLEEALARHAQEELLTPDAEHPAWQALQRSVEIMRAEAQRLRMLLAQP